MTFPTGNIQYIQMVYHMTCSMSLHRALLYKKPKHCMENSITWYTQLMCIENCI